MISSITEYIKKHRQGISITVFIAGSSYFIGKYAKWKIEEYRDRAGAERTAKENMKRRFQQRQNDCTYTVLSHLPTLGYELLSAIDVESVIAKLQELKVKSTSTPAVSPISSVVIVDEDKETTPTQTPSASIVLVEKPDNTESTSNLEGHDNEENAPSSHSPGEANVNGSSPSSSTSRVNPRAAKLELWSELKIKSFTRTISTIYLITFLTILIHIQLNLLGRFNYLYSVVSLTEREKEQTIHIQPAKGTILNFENEKRYLTFSWWLLNIGWKRVVERVRIVVERILSDMKIEQDISYKDFVWLISEIRAQVDFRHVMLPNSLEEEIEVLRQGGGAQEDPTIDDELRKLLDESKDFLDSDDFRDVLAACIDSAFSLLHSNMYSRFLAVPNSEEDDDDSEQIERPVALVRLLPDISKEAHVVINGVPNRYLEAVKNVKQLQELSAVIYSSFDEEFF
ncbi:444_t:CDS:2 [Ambispora gerdemannii]|uniref:444_t:CDS:1 n=1 Tax=Ambispora gerdemannii TaxID=144530 RepID=A0A9N8WB54_9GLOM|nr:444_t:CDS:2 [Ambispora gerdemannii]